MVRTIPIAIPIVVMPTGSRPIRRAACPRMLSAKTRVLPAQAWMLRAEAGVRRAKSSVGGAIDRRAGWACQSARARTPHSWVGLLGRVTRKSPASLAMLRPGGSCSQSDGDRSRSQKSHEQILRPSVPICVGQTPSSIDGIEMHRQRLCLRASINATSASWS